MNTTEPDQTCEPCRSWADRMRPTPYQWSRMIDTLSISTSGPGLTEFTRQARQFVRESGVSEGLLTVFVRHTSCSLLIQENADSDVQADLQAFFRRLVPHSDDPSMGWIIHDAEGPDDMPAHIKSVLIGPSLSLPISNGRLALGTWQGIYLCEHRDHGGARRLVATIQGE